MTFDQIRDKAEAHALKGMHRPIETDTDYLHNIMKFEAIKQAYIHGFIEGEQRVMNEVRPFQP